MMEMRRELRRTVKKWSWNVDQLYRKATVRMRRLPDFIIIGAQRSGTSSLYYYLTQHPHVLRASRKEQHYFDHLYPRGVDWYRSQFPYRNEGAITGEATPAYLLFPHTAKRIHQLLPNTRLIVLLRNPVERAISQYYLEVRHRNETLPLEQALAQEESRLAGEIEKMAADENYYSQHYRVYSYKLRGIYVDQIKRYHEHFDPAQMLILSSEKFFADTPGTLKTVFSFLGVDPDWMPSDLIQKNIGANKTPTSEELLRSLRSYFAPHNQRLYEYLGEDFHWD